ncbi:melanocortin-2 receptor accessory protein 2 isoform X3 [Pan troglodytes]|uniref:melanocortin-2 receptor accessory protein 2 isoform X3 n=1 Tax=Pan troglodytes TaxID=9598 RepID=UPI0007DBE541
MSSSCYPKLTRGTHCRARDGKEFSDSGSDPDSEGQSERERDLQSSPPLGQGGLPLGRRLSRWGGGFRAAAPAPAPRVASAAGRERASPPHLGSRSYSPGPGRWEAAAAAAAAALAHLGGARSRNQGRARGPGLASRSEMSAQRLISNRTSQQSASNSDYTWEYEYYEIGPVSFEGLKAHKYSIVIGFWVGLAVFVIFMFFVLTLLTKTGAPHQELPSML